MTACGTQARLDQWEPFTTAFRARLQHAAPMLDLSVEVTVEDDHVRWTVWAPDRTGARREVAFTSTHLANADELSADAVASMGRAVAEGHCLEYVTYFATYRARPDDRLD
jgi:predicted hotdog family 3-hydroxylacyl-ACP dehydratase